MTSEGQQEVPQEIQLHEQIDATRKLAMAGMDIPWLVQQWVDRSPDKPFFIWESFTNSANSEANTWSYARLQNDSHAVATALAKQGVKAGDFIIIHLDNSPEFIISWFACAALGAIAVSTNTRSVARDLSYFAEHVNAVGAITQPAFAELVASSCSQLEFICVTDNNAGEPAKPPERVNHLPFQKLLDTPIALPTRPTQPLDDLSVQFTSGTTSRPKAVLWTHANALWGGKIGAAHMRLQADDITLVFLPLFHTNAQSYSMLSTLWSGGTMVLQPKYSASRFWDTSLKHKITWCSMIPFAFKALASKPIPAHHYRFWGVGAHIPKIDQLFKLKTIGWWGMTETITHGTITDLDHPGASGNMGRAAPEYEIQIRDPQGALVNPGEKGKLFIHGVRGVTLFKEYFGSPEANSASFDKDGWFDTGDIVRVDANGDLFFADRDKDMLKVGAENVAASEIESVIMQTGLVNECAVVAQKHFMLDEVPVVFIIPNPGAPDDIKRKIIDHCKTNLADFKVVTDVYLVEELPRSTLEKIAKNELRARLPAITAKD
ncbi:MAG: AMP-binding protein [Pseudomonadales bacterium]|nr:AMP-binding protein [Pseudomonadales bacterium]